MKFNGFIAVLMLVVVNSTQGNHQFIREANITLQMPQNPQPAVFSYSLRVFEP